MIKKLIKHGNSSALILDKSLLEVLNIASETPLKIQTDGTSIIITPVYEDKGKKRTISKDPEVQKAFEEIMSKYGPLLKKLSKN
jgi:antitoxin component of MazEF toxin-antitoxin module